MSYGLKYTLTFRDSTVISNKLWQVNIYANGYSGSPISVTGNDSPVQISYKSVPLQTAICGSECTIILQATSAGQFDEFKTAAPLAYYVVIQNSTNGGSTWNNYWNGVNTTDTFTQAHSNAPYPVSLKFNCGLGELQWHRYENNGILASGLETILEVVNNCMTFLPFPNLPLIEMINVREDSMSDTAGLLEQLYISNMAITEIGDDGETHGWNCNKLLNNILTSINCRIYQSNGNWYIERIYERINTSLHAFTYSTYSTWQTNNDWLRNCVLFIGTVSGTFSSADEITGSVSGAIASVNTNKTSNLICTIASGTFQAGDHITGSITGATGIVTSVLQLNGTWAKGSASTINLERVISNSTYPKLIKSSEDAVTQLQPILTYKFNASSAGTDQLIPSPYFEDTPLSKDANGRPLRWVPSNGASFTCAAGGTVLTFSSSAIANGFVLGKPAQFYATNTIYNRVVLSRSGATITLASSLNGTSTSGNVAGVVQLGGDGLENIDPYETDAKYQSGYSFGSSVLSNNATYISNNYPNLSYITFNGSPYSLHALRSPSDTYTLPYVLLEPDNSQVIVNIRQYFKFKIQPTYTSIPTWTQTYNDAKALLNGFNTSTLMQIFFQNLSTDIRYYLSGQQQVQTGAPIAFNLPPQYYLLLEATMQELFANYPYQVGNGKSFGGPTNGGLSFSVAQSMFASSWNGTSCNPFYIAFDTTTSETIPLNSSTGFPFPSNPAAYAFDCTIYPCYPSAYTPPSGCATISLDDWAIRAVDLQYKYNAQSATNNVSFYSSNAGSNRWNELVINATFGDTDTNGYPGSFSVYTGVSTGTWHTRTFSDTGTTLVDIFFKTFAQIPAVYRYQLRGNPIYDNVLQYHHSVIDEDGSIYIQNGHTFEIKQNKYNTDMQSMLDNALPITPFHSSPTIPIVRTAPIPTSPKIHPPFVSPINTTPIKFQSGTIKLADPIYPI